MVFAKIIIYIIEYESPSVLLSVKLEHRSTDSVFFYIFSSRRREESYGKNIKIMKKIVKTTLFFYHSNHMF